jgi:hypothetical protein
VSDISNAVLTIIYTERRSSKKLIYELEYDLFNRVQDDPALRTVPYLIFGTRSPATTYGPIDNIGTNAWRLRHISGRIGQR